MKFKVAITFMVMIFIAFSLTACSGDGTQDDSKVMLTNKAGSLPVIDYDSSGNPVTLWFQSDGTMKTIWTNTYIADTGWGGAQLFASYPESDNIGDSNDYFFDTIVFDSNHNLINIWSPFTIFGRTLRLNRCSVDTGWETTQVLAENDNGFDFYQIAFDPNNNAIVVWSESEDYYNHTIKSKRYTDDSGWGDEQVVGIVDESEIYSLDIALDSSGNAIAIWVQTVMAGQQTEGVKQKICANRYTVGEGWGTTQVIAADYIDDIRSSLKAKISFDSSENAIVVWAQTQDDIDSVWANRYTAGTGWGTAETIAGDYPGYANSINITFDSRGNAIAVWWQTNQSIAHVWGIRYTSGIGWGTAQFISDHACLPKITFDTHDNPIALWVYNTDAQKFIWAKLLPDL